MRRRLERSLTGAMCASVLVSSTGTGGIEDSADESRTTRGRSSQPAVRHSAGSQLSRTQHSLSGLSRRWFKSVSSR